MRCCVSENFTFGRLNMAEIDVLSKVRGGCRSPAVAPKQCAQKRPKTPIISFLSKGT